ncbi:bifunctional metallophosphatase/5'-nucleotidase [Paenibacillus alkalitolerans]|uniref:bifunctional metallophosphatase/5'-nucleotidase n=1 Tax=Paenibacillus alkalitolerans TaxID=2799335 RepID=UPI0018F2EF6E|nr:bifunctional UDP-sugar hydrolase/5'-nucleotidase [Paenibacillus alkalitolerans]
MSDEKITFVVLHTNDLHSTFEAMPSIRTFFEAWQRRIPPGRLLKFDIGDHMDRMRPETEGTFGLANIDVMNATGYDACVLGNNEGLTFTKDMLDRAFGERARFAVIGTNMSLLSGGGDERLIRPEWLRPFLMHECEGVRIAVIGLTAPFNDFYRELGWKAEDPIDCARAWVQALRNEEKADMIIALSHLGLPLDKRLAEEVPGIDLILGGHTHHLLEETLVVGGSHIGAAGKFGTHAGVAEITVDRATRRPVSIKGHAADMSRTAASAELEALIERRAEDARAALQRVVATLDVPLRASLERESPLGNLLAADLRRRYKAEVGVVNAGQLLDGLEAGPVTAERLLAVCPSPINPCTMRLRGEYLLQALEEALLDDRIHMPIRGFGFRGKALGTLCLDGIRVEYDPAAPEGRKLQRAFVGDYPLQPEREYLLATLDMFTFRIGYPTLASGVGITYHLPEFIRDCLADRIRSLSPEQLNEAGIPRWIAGNYHSFA